MNDWITYTKASIRSLPDYTIIEFNDLYKTGCSFVRAIKDLHWCDCPTCFKVVEDKRLIEAYNRDLEHKQHAPLSAGYDANCALCRRYKEGGFVGWIEI